MDKLAVYMPLGLTSTNYELSTKDSAATSYRSTKTSGSDISLLYGVGFAFYPMEKLAISLEYNRSKIDLKSGSNVNLFDQTTLKTRANLDVIKLGVAYKF
jgi:opacity protein-like surface antigen